MIYFRSDYSLGAHPEVLEALIKTNEEHTDGYALDVHSERAEEMVKKLIGREDVSVYMMVGGTPCNATFITAALRPYEGVIAPRSAHIYFHETGAIESRGHRIITVNGINGKLTPEMIDGAFDEYEDEHTVLPKMVSISQPTEIGSIYSKAELYDIKEKCEERDLYLYIDGARMASALTSDDADFTIEDIAKIADGFYIGGTKNGALLGEALVISNPKINDHFRWMIKQNLGMLAKGRIIGVQFEALLEGGEDSLLYRIGRHENRMAKMLENGLKELGIEFYSQSSTNQIFPVLPTAVVEKLEEDFFFYRWAPERDGMTPIRLVTSWGTVESDITSILARLKEILI